jgi:plastocyanin domain-containing protein
VTKAQLSDGVQTVRVSANNSGYTPNILYVQKGVPVKWIIDGEQINSCNNEIVVPSLNIKKKLSSGENIIEITPQDQDISFSCWMGMIKGVIKVVDDVNAVDVTKDNTVIASESGCCNTEENSACCAAKPESIYGNDISNIPTERMIHKATINNNLQTIMLKGTGYELEPLVVVVEKHTPAKLAFDLTNFANAAGDWHLVDYPQQKTIASFTGRQGVVEVDFDQADASTFTIYKDDKITGVIEVVDELDATDLEKVRAKFF